MNLTFKINQSIDTVFEYLTDMQKFVSIHPIIEKIDFLAEDKYLVHETLKVGFIPFSFTYPVKVESNFVEKKITMKAVVMKMTKIEMNYILHTEKENTIINEIITFNSLLPIKSIMERIFKKQHHILFKNMDNLKN